MMNRDKVRRMLTSGFCISSLFPFGFGDDCIMYKAEAFSLGSEIIYIPDVELNEIPMYRSVREDEVEGVLDCCYSGDDFLDLCDGDKKLAEQIFWACRWQHPSTELDQLERIDEEEAE